MLNNAIDHSGSETARVSVGLESRGPVFVVADGGIGVFEHVRVKKGLEDHVAAIQEISKGKLTTDPTTHTGQGIFFTSKAVAEFSISSNGWRWLVDNERGDVSISTILSASGTTVRFVVDENAKKSLREVFDEYTDAESFAFNRSRTVVRLFDFGVAFVSRSEAKRLTRNLDQFEEVVVDFRGVEEIGQGFADEIFRVWQRSHPNVRLIPENMNEAVRSLVQEAQRIS
ncbi:MAG: STAS-like domain-containing protein [Actinomycetota bacterium]